MNGSENQGPRLNLSRRELLQRSLAAGAALGIPGLLAACGGGGGESAGTPATTAASTTAAATTAAAAAEPTRGGRLRTGHIGGGPAETIDPHTPTSGFSYIEHARYRAMYDQIARRTRQPGGAGGLAEWSLAESGEPNADRTVWQIKLRSGVVFHDGKPLTADDVLFSWQRSMDPKKGGGVSTGFGQALDLKQTKKISDLEIEVHLTKPIGDFADVISRSSFMGGVVPVGFDKKKPIGSGPFKLVSITPGQRSLMERNDDWWGGPAYLDELEHISIPDAQARFNALLGGQVDAIEFVDYPVAKANADNQDIVILRTPGDANVPFYVRVDTEPFKDNRVRTAFKLAVDREKMVEVALLGFGRVANDLFGPDHPFFNHDLEQRVYDPERAKALLAEAGYPDGLKVKLPTSNAVTGMYESATAFVSQAKAAGITVELQKIPADQQWDTSKFYLRAPFYQSNWGGFIDNIAQYWMAGDPPGSADETHFAQLNPDWWKLLQDANAELDPEPKKQLFLELQKQFWEEGPYIVWGYQDNVDAMSPKVKGIEPWPNAPLGAFYFEKVSIEA